MSGLENSTTIDFIGKTADGTITLVMFEPRPWGSDSDQLNQLNDKLNLYAEYVLDGELLERFPSSPDERVEIQLACAETPPPHVQRVIDRASVYLSNYNVGITTRVVPSLANR
jgi:hypothetical protein